MPRRRRVGPTRQKFIRVDFGSTPLPNNVSDRSFKYLGRSTGIRPGIIYPPTRRVKAVVPPYASTVEVPGDLVPIPAAGGVFAAKGAAARSVTRRPANAAEFLSEISRGRRSGWTQRWTPARSVGWWLWGNWAEMVAAAASLEPSRRGLLHFSRVSRNCARASRATARPENVFKASNARSVSCRASRRDLSMPTMAG